MPTNTPDLTTDLANVLTLVQRVFVGQCDVRREIARVLDRYAEDQRENFVQFTADRAMLDARASATRSSLERIELDGMLIPF